MNNNNTNNNNNNSKEETGRDTPQLYSAIVGGEGQDFVATTLSTSAQVRETEDHFFFHRHVWYFSFQSLQFPSFYICVSLSS